MAAEEETEKRCRAVVRKAEQLVASAMAGRDASHDAAHAFRVRDLALSLAREQEQEQQQQHASASPNNNNNNSSSSSSSSSISLEIAKLAALLHDIGDYKYTKNGVEDTTIVEKFLEEEGLEEAKRDKILMIIKGMGFKNEVSRGQLADSSLEFGIVQDADRLDAIGAIGIARCFIYGGSKGHVLYDPEILPRQDLSKEKYMGKDEKQTTINHFHEKLFKLKDLMKTNAGKRRAIKRHQFMQDFVTEFYEEWSGRA